MNRNKLLRAKEMFPELADTSNKNRFLDFIKVPDYLTFCKESLKHLNLEITEYNNKVAEFVLDLLIRKELLTPINHQTYVDSLLVAAFLHNAFYGKNTSFEKYSLGFDENINELLSVRQHLDDIANSDTLYIEGPIPEQFREMIWDTIEGQLGDCTPMAKTKPSPNSPQDLFANAVFFAKTYFAEQGVDYTTVK